MNIIAAYEEKMHVMISVWMTLKSVVPLLSPSISALMIFGSNVILVNLHNYVGKIYNH